MPPLSEPPDPWSIFALGPVPLRLVVGVAGGLLLLAGRRLWPVLVALPGALVGIGLALAVGGALSLPTGPVLGIAAVAGGIGGLVARFAERLALVAAGCLAGLAVVHGVAPSLPPPWYAWPVAALVGAVAGPLVWRALLAPITAVVGAAALASAAGVGDRAGAVVVLAVVGVVVQVALGRRRAEREVER